MSCGKGVRQSLEDDGDEDGSSDENASVGVSVEVENVPTANTSRKICTDNDLIVIVAVDMVFEWLPVDVVHSQMQVCKCSRKKQLVSRRIEGARERSTPFWFLDRTREKLRGREIVFLCVC